MEESMSRPHVPFYFSTEDGRSFLTPTTHGVSDNCHQLHRNGVDTRHGHPVDVEILLLRYNASRYPPLTSHLMHPIVRGDLAVQATARMLLVACVYEA